MHRKDACPRCANLKQERSKLCRPCAQKEAGKFIATFHDVNGKFASRAAVIGNRKRGQRSMIDLGITEIDLLAYKYVHGATCAELAPEFRVSANAIRLWLTRLGISLRRRGARRAA